jgi:Bifunctional DNA primase/polymerase, N-terminal
MSKDSSTTTDDDVRHQVPPFIGLTSMQEAAVAYAEYGWRVIPLWGIVASPTGGLVCECPKGAKCGERSGKHPRFVGWQAKATINPEIARSWWCRFPDANIGITTGPHLTVLDLDPRHGSDASLAALESRFERLPATLTAFTGGGGEHRLFTCPEDRLVGQTLPVLADYEGIDVRGQGGLFVVPPSRHRSGNLYSWQARSKIDLAPIPMWLIEGVPHDPSGLPCPDDTDPYAWALLYNECERVREAQKGKRNPTLLMAAGRVGQILDAGDLDECTATEALLAAAEACGLDDDEAEDVVKRSLAWGRDRPQPLDAPFTSRAEAMGSLAQIRAAFYLQRWPGHRGNRMVITMEALLRIAYRAGGPSNFGASTRRIALEAGTKNLETITRALLELREEGWVVRLLVGQTKKDKKNEPSRWRLRIPKQLRTPNLGTAQLQFLPVRSLQHPSLPIGHDAFRGAVPENSKDIDLGWGDRAFRMVPRGLGKKSWVILEWLVSTRVSARRSDLARALGKNPSTIGRNVAPLIERGLVVEDDQRFLTAAPLSLEALDALAEGLGTDGAAVYQRERNGWEPIAGRPPETSALTSTAEVHEDVGDAEDEAGVA